MPSLTIPKTYEDGSVLFASDMANMWSAVETLINTTGVDSDNVQTGTFGHFANITFSDDSKIYFGTSSTAYIMHTGSSDLFVFSNTNAGSNIQFKLSSTVAASISGSNKDLSIGKELIFAHRNTTYSLAYLLATYAKPVLVWQSGTEVSVEANTPTSNQTLIMLPSGPVAVTEDIGVTHKFRKLQTGATANGYGASHTGAADSGIRSGLSLAANTWYFVYAVRVQYGDDAGNNFILVLDDTSPVQANESTLNTRYGSNEWVYLGCVRRGYGAASTTTTALCQFQMNHQGWTHIIVNDTNDAAGIEISRDNIAGSGTSTWTLAIGNSGTSIPAVVDSIQIQTAYQDDSDNNFKVTTVIIDPVYATELAYLPYTFSNAAGTKGGFAHKLPNVSGLIIRAAFGTEGDCGFLLSGWSDFYV